MADVFDVASSSKWTFNAVASTLLKHTTLGMDPATVEFGAGPDINPTHDAKYWAEKTCGFDFSEEDRVPAELYNKILWEGLKGICSRYPNPRGEKRAVKPQRLSNRWDRQVPPVHIGTVT